MTVSGKSSNRMLGSGKQLGPRTADPGKLKGKKLFSTTLIFGRFISELNISPCFQDIAREIWPSDGGCIELNRKELKRFITNNEARRLSGSKLSRHVAGGSSLEYASDSTMQHTSRDDSTLTSIQSFNSVYRSDLYKVCQHKEKSLTKLSRTALNTDSNKDVKAQQQLHVQGNFAQLNKDASSDISMTTITESPETLISSETTDLTSPTADESSSNKNGQPTGARNFIQNRGDQLVPTMKPDGTIVIPGVVHVDNFESLNGVVLKLKVLIKSSKESRRLSLNINCPDFKPRSVKVNGIETHIL
ncbi:hypothetical protein LOAG_01387 [Loa loa]|uniref:Uncharacterized protein n=1 Tax=Loa loa TaxID=7209 RepID=A0A1S0UB28_LOALO|nr:hypothetical protein LOAG_01387 [Loa loa]EFO27098.2 hypothetical protein LOAG_01387 [Loa loa]